MALADLAATVKAKQEEMLKMIRAAGEPEIKAALKEIFAAHPSIASIRWTQYTPYFNDGEPCVFSVNSAEFILNGEDEWHDTWGDWDATLKKSVKTPLHEAIGRFSNEIETLGSAMLHIFGDHKIITCTREEIAVDEYDHE